MSALFVLALLALSIWILFAVFKRLRRLQVGRGWWLAFVCFLVIGIGLGYWLAFFAEYQISPTMRFISFPMPLGFFHLEDGRWVDFPTPEYVMYPGIAVNILAITALAVTPLLAASLVAHRGK
jgi:hypothetical protein